MQITVLEAGKWDSFKCRMEDGKTAYLKPGKFVTTPIEVGKSYDVEIWQKEGTKTVYINKVKGVGKVAVAPISVAPTAEVKRSRGNVPGKPSNTRGQDSPANAVAGGEIMTEIRASTPPPAMQWISGKVDSEKMTKADWAKKDLEIKWLTCLKASAEFNAQRADYDVKKVIDDAIKMYYATPESQADGAITEDDVDLNVFKGL